MTRKKKTGRGAHKVRSRGVWIAPDLERKIKGEGGRRGLAEPPYSYYLHLADLVLKPAATASGSSTGNRERQGGAPEPSFEPQSLQSFEPSQKQSTVMDGAQTVRSPMIDLIPAPMPPLAPALLLPKLNRPKPPKQPRMPKRPKVSPPKLPPQKQRAKLSLPKPPKRNK